MATTDDPELEYLQPGFDPASLTMPKIRGILVAHSVPFPASAKKAQLVEIFNENIVPQARKILSARARTKRSTKGIVDVPSSQEPSVSDGEEQQRPARTPGRPSKKSAVPSSTAPSTSRKSRKSLSGTRADADTNQTSHVKTENNGSPFSAENPFQSGSSPYAEPEPRSPSRRRTLGNDEKKEKRKRSSSRRKTDGTTLETPSNAVPSSSRKRTSVPSSSIVKTEDVPTGEEFTPEEQQSLALERRERTQQIRPALRQPQSSKSRSFLKVAPWAALLALSGGAATVWRQEKIQVGFCGVGRPSGMIAGVEIPPWADQIRPECEPCPPHTYCHANLEATCEPGFVHVPHPLSLGGLVPLPPTCEPDGEKARKVKAVADRAVEELRERNAQVECGELKDEQGKRVTTAEIEETKLKEAVASKRRKGMSQEEFEELWDPAIAEILSRDEIISNDNGQTINADPDNGDGPDHPASHEGSAGRALRRPGRRSNNHTLRSTSLAKIPLACAIRRSIRHSLARHLWQLAGVIGVIIAALYAKYVVSSRRATEARAKQLASLALDRLAAQAALHARDASRFPETWISMAQLRDDVLRDEFNAKRRALLWDRVQSKVESNSNVRSSVREGRSGDVSRVWEWIGALDWLDLDDVASPGGGRAGGGARYSFGASAASTPAAAWRGAGRQREMEEVGARKTWEEARPAY